MAEKIVRRTSVAQVCKVRKDGWTVERREQFLSHLAATCNVAQSAKAAGMQRSSVRRLKLRDPTFAALWQQALDAGYETLETKLLELAIGEGDNPDDFDPGDGDRAQAVEEPAGIETPGDRAAFDPNLALRVLERRDRSMKGFRTYPTRAHKLVTLDEAAAVIERRLVAIERRLRREGRA